MLTWESIIYILLTIHTGKCNFPTNEEVDEKNSKTEQILAFVGVGFKHKMKEMEFANPATDRVNLDLLTSHRRKLFGNTWIKLQYLTNELYGFPLDGNQGGGIKQYIVRTTIPDTGEIFEREVNVYVSEIHQEFFHEIKICTSLTNKDLLYDLDIRYGLIEKLANYLLSTEVQNVKIREFDKNCFWFSFINIEDGRTCDREKMKQLASKLTEGKEVSRELRKQFIKMTTILSANITLTGECLKPQISSFKSKLKWLKTVAPLLLLGAVVMIPVSISCYVCRGVRRRQNAMRQLQDKRLKEEQAAMTEQVNQYKRFCQLHEDEYQEDEQIVTMPKWKETKEKKQKTFLKNMFELYVPYGIQDKIDQGSSLFENPNAKKLISKKGTFNPFSKMLKIKTPAMKKREQELLDIKNKVRKRPIINPINPSMLSDLNLNSHSVIPNKPINSRLENELRRMDLNRPLNLSDKRTKSVSFVDLTNKNKLLYNVDTNSIYRKSSIPSRPTRLSTSLSCTAVDTLGNMNFGVSKSSLKTAETQTDIIPQRKLSSVIPRILSPRRNSSQPFNSNINNHELYKNNQKGEKSYTSFYDNSLKTPDITNFPNNNPNSVYKNFEISQPSFYNNGINYPNTGMYRKKPGVIESVKNLAIYGTRKLSITIKDSLIRKSTNTTRTSNFARCRSMPYNDQFMYNNNTVNNNDRRLSTSTYYQSPRDTFILGDDYVSDALQNISQTRNGHVYPIDIPLTQSGINKGSLKFDQIGTLDDRYNHTYGYSDYENRNDIYRRERRFSKYLPKFGSCNTISGYQMNDGSYCHDDSKYNKSCNELRYSGNPNIDENHFNEDNYTNNKDYNAYIVDNDSPPKYEYLENRASNYSPISYEKFMPHFDDDIYRQNSVNRPDEPTDNYGDNYINQPGNSDEYKYQETSFNNPDYSIEENCRRSSFSKPNEFVNNTYWQYSPNKINASTDDLYQEKWSIGRNNRTNLNVNDASYGYQSSPSPRSSIASPVVTNRRKLSAAAKRDEFRKQSIAKARFNRNSPNTSNEQSTVSTSRSDSLQIPSNSEVHSFDSSGTSYFEFGSEYEYKAGHNLSNNGDYHATKLNNSNDYDTRINNEGANIKRINNTNGYIPINQDDKIDLNNHMYNYVRKPISVSIGGRMNLISNHDAYRNSSSNQIYDQDTDGGSSMYEQHFV